MPALVGSAIVDVILLIIFVIIGIVLMSKGGTTLDQKLVFLIVGAIFLLVGLYVGLVLAGIV